MLKKLLFVVALVAVGAASYGVARAYFSKEAPVSNATFKAGTINIDLAQHAGYNEVPFSMENWMPGQTQDVVVDVVNTSTVPVTLSGHVDGTWGGTLGDQMVHVIAANYWNGSSWALLDTTGNGTFTYAGPVPANGGIATLRMTAKFEPEAGDVFQGETYTAAIHVTAEQVH